MGKYNPEHETVLNDMLRGVPGATPGKMFGYPAYKVNGKWRLACLTPALSPKLARSE